MNNNKYYYTSDSISAAYIAFIMSSSCLCYLPQPSASADNTDLGFDNSRYHAQPHPIIIVE